MFPSCFTAEKSALISVCARGGKGHTGGEGWGGHSGLEARETAAPTHQQSWDVGQGPEGAKHADDANGGKVIAQQVAGDVGEPAQHDNEVHDVPRIAKVRASSLEEALGTDLAGHLHGEDDLEDDLHTV